jgi:leader peptidase (prepilin peptidase) / N-methyltransferase
MDPGGRAAGLTAVVAVGAGAVVAVAGAGKAGLVIGAAGVGVAVGAVVAATSWSAVPVPDPAIVAGVGAAFAALAVRFGWSWTLPAEATFIAGLVALAGCDLDRLVLPNRILYPMASITAGWLLIAAGAGGDWSRLGVAALCSVAAFAVFGVVNLVNPRWLGFGDVRLAAAVGLALGWVGPGAALFGFVLANGLGIVVALVLLGLRWTTRQTPLPFGVFLATGAVVALLGGTGFAR